MLPKVNADNGRGLGEFRKLIPENQYSEIEDLANNLQGLRVIHINATPEGGGPAMLLQALVPLMRDVGLEAEWYVIPPGDRFAKILMTKRLHNAMQGDESVVLTDEEKEAFYRDSEKLASLVDDLQPDMWVLHDLQTWGMGRFIKNRGGGVVSRIHVDSTSPNKGVLDFLLPYEEYYDQVIFSMDEFAFPGMSQDKVLIFPPAIDPFAEQNHNMPADQARDIVEKFGIDTKRPLLVNISRFDPWKDPLGTVDAYRSAKKRVPDLQLAFLGLMLAADDPDAAAIYKQTKEYAGDDKDVFLFAGLAPLKEAGVDIPTFVRAFRSAADVVIHKSSREGFGMTVTESMLFKKPVIGGDVGGIKAQIEDGVSGFLVHDTEEAADRIVRLAQDDTLRFSMGNAAYERVLEKFLTPRLLRDYLKLFTKVKK